MGVNASARKVMLHLHREHAAVEDGIRQLRRRQAAAHAQGQTELFWQQLWMAEAIAELEVGQTLDQALASAIGLLWRCGLVERLPETCEEMIALGIRIRDAAKLEGVSRGN
jgi:hypothetical protein